MEALLAEGTNDDVRGMIARGEITGYRLGSARMIRIDVAELDDLAQPIPSAMIGQAS